MSAERDNKPVRVMLFIDSLVAGGAQRQLVETGLQLARMGYRITVLIYHDIRELGDELAAAGIEVVLVEKRAKLDIGFLWRLYRALRVLRPDILHSFLFTPNLWGRLLGRAAGIPLVITSERNIDLPRSRLRVWIERLVHPLSDCIIVNAEAIREVLVSYARVPTERIRTVYNGVDMARFEIPKNSRMDVLRSEFSIATEDFVITLPGRVIPQKNHACLLRAFATLDKEKHDRARLLFVGNLLDDGYRDGLGRLIERMALGERVVFAGRQEDMAAVYALSDVVVLPSLWEGFPNVVLEAMAAGRPVVASDIADNDILISNEKTGFLFPNDDEAALAAVLEGLLEMPPAQRKAIGLAGQRLVHERYTPEALAAATAAIYRELLDRRGIRQPC